jgi:hypothetical protein
MDRRAILKFTTTSTTESDQADQADRYVARNFLVELRRRCALSLQFTGQFSLVVAVDVVQIGLIRLIRFGSCRLRYLPPAPRYLSNHK